MMSEHDESEHEAGVAVSPAADLARVIRARDFPALHEMLKHWSPPTTASLIEALSVEDQVVAIFAGVRGYLDGVRADDVTRFETALMSEIRAKHGDILKAIREQKEISNDTEAKLKAVLDQFVKTFA